MKPILKAMSLSMLLASPLTLAITAQAQESFLSRPSIPIVAQSGGLATPDQEFDAFHNSKFDYWDAKVLADFWNEDVSETKAHIGRKLLFGGESKAILEQHIVDARFKALGSVEDLRLFGDAGFSYSDAEALAEFWGDPSPWDSKLRIERNLILGQYEVVNEALELSRKP